MPLLGAKEELTILLVALNDGRKFGQKFQYGQATKLPPFGAWVS
jgi:hypothetical protein